MIVQILRSVSSHPWGSSIINHITPQQGSANQLVWITSSPLLGKVVDHTYKRRVTFPARSHVLQTIICVSPGGQLKLTRPDPSKHEWAESPLASQSSPHIPANGPSGLEIDITSLVLNKKSSTNPIEALHDN